MFRGTPCMYTLLSLFFLSVSVLYGILLGKLRRLLERVLSHPTNITPTCPLRRLHSLPLTSRRPFLCIATSRARWVGVLRLHTTRYSVRSIENAAPGLFALSHSLPLALSIYLSRAHSQIHTLLSCNLIIAILGEGLGVRLQGFLDATPAIQPSVCWRFIRDSYRSVFIGSRKRNKNLPCAYLLHTFANGSLYSLIRSHRICILILDRVDRTEPVSASPSFVR